jgi:hypothetical protein
MLPMHMLNIRVSFLLAQLVYALNCKKNWKIVVYVQFMHFLAVRMLTTSIVSLLNHL